MADSALCVYTLGAKDGPTLFVDVGEGNINAVEFLEEFHILKISFLRFASAFAAAGLKTAAPHKETPDPAHSPTDDGSSHIGG